MLLDSTFLLHLEREVHARQNDPDLPPGPAEMFLERHATQRFVISTICAGEFYAGSQDFGDARRFLARFRRLEVHEAVALEAGRLEREQRRRGQLLGENDNWIAATARLHRRPLVTRDTAFRRVRRLKTVPYCTESHRLERRSPMNSRLPPLLLSCP
jgi:predicted nucleic acid-binding protein